MRLPHRLFFAVLATGVALRADVADDVARLHLEALGGRVHVGALVSLRATGWVRAGTRELRFEFVAQRPNRVRTTTRGEGQTLIQATDGSAPPWLLEPEKSSLARPLSEGAAGEFAGDAEFDDPLVDSVARGYTLDYAGETDDGGRKLIKLLVTHRTLEPCELLVDAETYFIAKRIRRKRLPSGREAVIEVRYEEFRAVAGVFLPFRIAIVAENRVLLETVIEFVVPNVMVDASAFVMPLPPVQLK